MADTTTTEINTPIDVSSTTPELDTRQQFVDSFITEQKDLKVAQTNVPTFSPSTWKDQIYLKDDGTMWVNIKNIWQEFSPIYTATLATPDTSLTLNNVPNKPSLRITINVAGFATPSGGLWVTFNGDTGNNYSFFTNVNRDKLDFQLYTTGADGGIVEMSISNVATSRKIACWTGSDGAANANARLINTGYWTNTTSRITSITLTAGYNMSAGTSITIL